MTRTFKLTLDGQTVAEGATFSDGQAVIHTTTSRHPITTVHPDGLDSVMYTAGPDTRLVWDDDGIAPTEFTEDDVALLHDVLEREVDAQFYGRARKLLSKVRAAMNGQTIP